MVNSITIGTITIHQSNNGRYSLNDLHKASGGEKRHSPNYWLETDQAKEMVAEILNTGIPVFKNTDTLKGGIPAFKPIETLKGRYGGTYACKELVYSYAMWISAKFALTVIRTFDALLNATTPDELQAIKDKLSWSMGELVQMEARHPKDERTLSAILGKACSQVYPYFKHFVGIGELEQVRVPQPDKFIYRPTPRSTIVIGSKGDTLLFDAKAVKKLLPTQLDLVDFVGGSL